MKRLLLLAGMGFVAGCTSSSVPDDAASLNVSFQFTEEHRCSAQSPQITVSGAPTETAQYTVRLRDHQAPAFNHGGGTVAASGDVIPAGALRSYTGPCPPSGQHTYEITVNALDAGGKIVGRGSATQRF